ncbi:YOL057W [[Candida] subhashii]|uniref:Dipeptidyl peptidase 3 n=1 Tax=[Candida] subhashii TaxID=561895 RepID=A0A8J5QLX9_9ASCO|nr:YOL057W [[Candida] subhashii]KAG7662996.1 YOL057W [[Candida] subhashii]
MAKEHFYADTESPIVSLSAKKHFDALSTQDAKLYAHYLSRASFHGSRAVLRSVSPESEDIYDLIILIHEVLGQPKTNSEYEEKLAQVDKIVVNYYLEYVCQFLSNLGNYKSFGDVKFIPRIEVNQFDDLINSIGNGKVSELYSKVRHSIYEIDTGSLLGWPEKGQVSNYYPNSPDITKTEVDSINQTLASNGIMPENTRVEKVSQGEFIVHVASAETGNTTDYYPKQSITTPEGWKISFKFGDGSGEFKQIVENLQAGLNHVANPTQKNLISYYIESFKTGSMNAHKQSQIEWVKDIKPEVESNIGFIETYRDPSGVRGEWEGLVAMVNHERTAKFSKLVENAGYFIQELPWDKIYEKDTFTPPDFTSLEVLTFAGSGIPAGINIPNYDDVRLNYGFKNVSLGNVLSANPKNPKKPEAITFIDPSKEALFKKWRDDAFEVQVGLHELLGHGTGKLLQETSPGKFNFDKNDERITSWYGPNDTWGSLFGITAGSFEECRAELVALYLILKKPLEVLPIFGIDKSEDQKDVIYIATLLMIRAGLIGLEFWDPSSTKWGQPHMQARFGIFKQLHKAGVFSLDFQAKDFDDLQINIDESKLDNVAIDALGDFLGNLHVYKCTGNVKEGVAYYVDKTTVNPEYSRFRDIVLKKKQPRKKIIQANSFINENNEVELIEYDESEVGMIQSYFDRKI